MWQHLKFKSIERIGNDLQVVMVRVAWNFGKVFTTSGSSLRHSDARNNMPQHCRTRLAKLYPDQIFASFSMRNLSQGDGVIYVLERMDGWKFVIGADQRTPQFVPDLREFHASGQYVRSPRTITLELKGFEPDLSPGIKALLQH